MYIFALILCLVAVVRADVVNLQSHTFDDFVGGDKGALVEFFAPWCGHCKNLAPEWKIAGETFQESDGIVIAAVDATENQDLASQFGVQGYPTIKYFPAGSKEPEEYTGGRTADTIVQWVNEKIGTRRVVKKAPSSVTALTTSSFDQVVNDPTKTVFLEFFAPWCGHCKSLAPKYEELAKVYAGDTDIVIASVDVTAEEELGRRYEVSGFPTLKIVPKGEDRSAIDYQSARELEPMVEFVNEHAGTSRLPNGELDNAVGRSSVLDALVMGAPIDAALVSKLESTDGGKWYASHAKKIIKKGGDVASYVVSEKSRLTNMINSDSVGASKKTDFMIRRNILDAFA